MSEIPNCVPEYYRSMIEDKEYEDELEYERTERYRSNKAKIEKAKADGFPVLSLAFDEGCEKCWDCATKDSDTMTSSDDDIELIICLNPQCPHLQSIRCRKVL